MDRQAALKELVGLALDDALAPARLGLTTEALDDVRGLVCLMLVRNVLTAWDDEKLAAVMGGQPDAYLRRVLRNTAVSYLRSERRHARRRVPLEAAAGTRLPAAPISAGNAVTAGLEDREEYERLTARVAALEPERREDARVAMDVIAHGARHLEVIAARRGVSPRTARRMMERGLLTLRHCLQSPPFSPSRE